MIEQFKPEEIEKKSFEIITQTLGERVLNPFNAHVIKRCIHTSADFDYVDNLYFSDNVVQTIETALKNGAHIVTDTQMAKAGINKLMLKQLGIEAHCFIADDDVAQEALKRGTTRAAIAVEKAMKLSHPVVFAVGNAPTALIKIHELVETAGFAPKAIIAVPVGFVNVIESKELVMQMTMPCIVAKGRKGGSNIAAAICNAIMYGPERNNHH